MRKAVVMYILSQNSVADMATKSSFSYYRCISYKFGIARYFPKMNLH